MLASIVANHGQLLPPRLLRDRHTILGESVVRTPPAVATRVASQQAADTLTRAMMNVVTSPRGTGRRAAVPGFTIAMKTGTSGSSNPGYDALIMAFAPVGSPRYAVGIVAEHVGPAELEGARIAHDLFERLKMEK
jgi:cell division protein FtsI/penicillin-binding protein 2